MELEAQQLNKPAEGPDDVIAKVKRTYARRGVNTAVVRLDELVVIPVVCNKETLARAAMAGVVNRRALIPDGEELTLFLPDDPLEWVLLALVHFDPSTKNGFVIAAGYVCLNTAPISLRVTGLPQTIPADDTVVGGDDSPAPSVASSVTRVPLPLCIPCCTDLNTQSAPVGDLMSMDRLGKLLTVFTDLLVPGEALVPSGACWWAWASEEVGTVNRNEDRYMFYFFLLSICRNQSGRDMFKRDYTALISRCVAADPSFLGRVRGAFPAYVLCHNSTTLENMIGVELDKIWDLYKSVYYAPESSLVYTLPEFVKNALDIIRVVYDVS